MFLYGRNSILLVLLLAQAGSGALLNYSFTEDQDAGVPSGSKLAGAVVIFRDVVRTPLQNRYLHTDIQWSNCSFAMSGVPELELKTPDGKPLVKKGEQEHHSVLPGGCSLGMVTEAGLKQGIALGTWLRQRYLEKHKLLQPPLVSADGEAGKGLYLRTTPHNRSIISLRGVLAGLLNEGASISSSMPKKVSVQAELPEQESLYANVANCKVLGKLMKQAEKKAHSLGEMEEDGRDASMSVRMFLGLPEHDRHGWISWKRLLDAIMCLEGNGLPLYSGYTKMMHNTIDKEATRRVVKVLGPRCTQEARQEGTSTCKQVLQLSVGSLLAQIQGQLAAAAECGAAGGGQCGPRLALYSAHDATLMPLMAVLGQPVKQWPPFASSLVFELWQAEADKAFSVRILYNGLPLSAQQAGQQGSGQGGQQPTAGVAAGSMEPLPAFSEKLKVFHITPEQHRSICQQPVDGDAKAFVRNAGQVVGAGRRRG